MKPNPCKWCGRGPREVRGEYWCNNYDCQKNYFAQSFDTWQKNNPLQEVINSDNLLQQKPHQFKLGDWVKCTDGKGKITNISGGQGKTLIDVVGKRFETCHWEDEIEPRLKRKEIRERLEEINMRSAVPNDWKWAKEQLAKLIEEI